MGQEDVAAWRSHWVDLNRQACEDRALVRWKRLRFIWEHIGADVVCANRVVYDALSSMFMNDEDVDKGMALLIRRLAGESKEADDSKPMRCLCNEDVEPRWFICDTGRQRMSSIHCDHCRVSAVGSTREQSVQAWNNMQRNMRKERS